jgi:predicted phosphodiesterase
MRALVLSDIHSNIDALEAVLEAAPPHDAVWNLGDIVGYNAAPNAVLERVRALGNVFVRGNHDRACCGLLDPDYFNPVALAAVEWTIRQLDPEAIEWLRTMPHGPVYLNTSKAYPSTQDSAVACVHGSPLDEDEYLLSVRDAVPALAAADSRITFFGHTHVQGGFALNADGDAFSIQPAYINDNQADSYELSLRDGATYLINPGSVGQPRDRDWRAAFALYDSEAARVTYCRVPYDVRMAQMRIQRAGLPDPLAARLRVGK